MLLVLILGGVLNPTLVLKNLLESDFNGAGVACPGQRNVTWGHFSRVSKCITGYRAGSLNKGVLGLLVRLVKYCSSFYPAA